MRPGWLCQAQLSRHGRLGAAPCRQYPLLALCQAEQHARQVRLLEGGLDDPAREAEVQLLHDDCHYLKVSLQRGGVGRCRKRWQQGVAPCVSTAAYRLPELRPQARTAGARRSQHATRQHERLTPLGC